MSEYKHDLSIIIPCHNSGNTIAPLLYSLIRQYMMGLEVQLIFVNDTPDADNTNKLITAYLKNKRYDVIIFSHLPCLQAEARNYGLEQSDGEYVWFIDSDDWLIDDNAIVKLIAMAKRNKDKIISFDYEAPQFFPFKHLNCVMWNYIFRRDFLGDDIRFPLQTKDEDVVFLQSVLKKAKAEFIDELKETSDNPDLVDDMTDEQITELIRIPLLEEAFIYYNYGRMDSVTNQLQIKNHKNYWKEV